MNIKEEVPVIAYDNQYYLCVKFAKIINSITKDNITMIGHYSELSIKLRKTTLKESATEMFWVIDKKQHMLKDPHFYHCEE